MSASDIEDSDTAYESLADQIESGDNGRPTRRHLIRGGIGMLTALFAIYVLLPQLAHIDRTITALRNAQTPWLVATIVICATTYLSAAVSLIGAVGKRLPIGLTWEAQVAAAFTNRFAPAGVGGMATNVMFLTKNGNSRPAAVAAIGLNSFVGFLVHLAGLLIIVPLVSHQRVHLHLLPSDPDLPRYWYLLVCVVALLVGAGLVRWRRHLHGLVLQPLREVIRSLAHTASHPAAASALVLGAIGITAGYMFALVTSAEAFGLELSVGTVAAIYLGGSAIASVAPTPGGLGALEAALVAGLTAVGGSTPQSVATVLSYRLITYWLPIIPGFVFYRSLRRSGAL